MRGLAGQLGRVRGRAEPPALEGVDPELLQQGDRGGRLDALGDDLDLEGVRRADHAAHLPLGGGVGEQRRDDLGVDLDLAHRGEGPQRAQRGRVPAEAVDADPHPGVVDLLEERGDVGRRPGGRLGDLQHQRRRVVPGATDPVDQVGDQPAGGHVARRDVERETGAGGHPAQRGQVGEGAVEDRVGERAEQPAALGLGQEVARQQQPELGVLPAHEGLEAGDEARQCVDLRLVVDGELPGVHGVAQLGDQARAVHRGEHGVGEVAEGCGGVAAGALDGVHRLVRGPGQLLEGVAVAVEHGHADRGGDRDLQLLDRQRRAHDGDDPGGEVGGVVDAGQGRGEDGELVAAEADQEVVRADHGAEPAGHLDQHGVALVVTEQVVDPLEPVEVEQEQRHRAPGGAGQRERQGPAVPQHAAVGQTGQRVRAAAAQSPYDAAQQPPHLAQPGHRERRRAVVVRMSGLRDGSAGPRHPVVEEDIGSEGSGLESRPVRCLGSGTPPAAARNPRGDTRNPGGYPPDGPRSRRSGYEDLRQPTDEDAVSLAG
ncbi:conserved hypothetical protein [Nocardioides sp. AX2bis]|nr:conserved hypothetical protein [Nocardioides sp. AX2bis]